MEDLDQGIRAWVDNKQENGIYLFDEGIDGKGRQFIIFSKKTLEYNYQVGKAYFNGKKLVIKVNTNDAQNDSEANDKLIFGVRTKEIPEKIELYVDGRETNFKEITK